MSTDPRPVLAVKVTVRCVDYRGFYGGASLTTTLDDPNLGQMLENGWEIARVWEVRRNAGGLYSTDLYPIHRCAVCRGEIKANPFTPTGWAHKTYGIRHQARIGSQW